MFENCFVRNHHFIIQSECLGSLYCIINSNNFSVNSNNQTIPRLLQGSHSYLNFVYFKIIHICNTYKIFLLCALLDSFLHPYIIDHYNPSVRIIDLVSHTTYVVCVNFIHGTYSLKSTPNDRFLRNFSWQFYLLSEFLTHF